MSADTDRTLRGLDALELAAPPRRRAGGRLWGAAWPKLAALTLVLGAWQCAVWLGWKDPSILPGPAAVGRALRDELTGGALWSGLATTGRRALLGYGLAVVVGLLLGLSVARWRVLRSAFGALLAAVQSMPSIAWFPLAVLLFSLGDPAIMFVVVLGAAPAVAAGVLGGVDYVPRLWIRAGRAMGARGLSLYWHVVGPAALPATVAGLKQGWAFAWRSLMAGELLVTGLGQTSLGAQLSFARELFDTPRLVAYMVVILAIGLAVDAVFGGIDAALRRRWGTGDPD